MNNILGRLRKTIQDQNMIQPNDRVAVGLSGGKDSMALLSLLNQFKRFSPTPFHLEAMTIDLGFDNFNLKGAHQFCDTIDIPYSVIKTDIAKIVFDIREEKNPCALCANMRRGALANAMQERKLNVLALGHHADDALSTLFLNMLYAGKLNTMEYKSLLSRSAITVIRPLLDTAEVDIKHFIKMQSIPVLKSPCPMDRHTKREDVSLMLKEVYKTIPNSRKNMLTAMRNAPQCNLFNNDKEPL